MEWNGMEWKSNGNRMAFRAIFLARTVRHVATVASAWSYFYSQPGPSFCYDCER